MSENQNNKNNIAVIGAGVVGLSTALCIQIKNPNASVTLIADKFEKQTLSDGAGGLFRPEFNIGPSISVLKQWCKESYEHFSSILKSADAGEAGVQRVSGYYLSSLDESYCENPILSELLSDLRKLSHDELAMFPCDYKNGLFFTTVIIDCRRYLPWLRKKFEQIGGKITVKTIESFEELTAFEIIVNCTGLRAKELTDDFKLVPVRGQTIKVRAPWIKHFYYGDEVYVIPGVDYVTLGGIKEFGSWNPNINPYHKNLIWEKCTKLVPSLKKAKVEWEWVGLRPFRQPVRVEKEVIQHGQKYFKIVHNYGHGGHGVTLSWGTAKHAEQLVSEMMRVSKL